MARRILLQIGLLVLAALCLSQAVECLTLPDSEALLLYNFFEQKPGASFPSGWRSDRTYWACEDAWAGIECIDVGSNARLAALELENFAFGGTIPSFINVATYLDTLTLSGLGLIGTIPSVISTLPLIYLDLQSNQLNGSVPSGLWSKSLTTLNLERNELTGDLPNFPSATVTWVQLILSANHFSGTISSTIANLQSVSVLAFDSNNLTGTLPAEVFSLPSLYSLDLSDNQLSGSIPSFNNGATELVVVDLSNNAFTGSIPDLSGSTSLTSVNLGLNSLTGTIPDAVTQITTLASFVCRENQLTGMLPPSFTAMVNLTLWDISYNQIQGTIPTQLYNLPILSHFAIGHNNFGGTIPVELCLLKNVSYLNFNNNGLSGVLPECIGHLAELTSFYADFNQISGTIPANFGNLTELTLLSLTGNQLTGTIPKDLANATNLETLLLGSNGLSADIPIQIAQLIKLTSLDLSSNNLVGPFPYTIGSIPSLKQLQIGDNNLSCPLGSFFNQLLEACDASGNWMCGGTTDAIFSPTCAVYFAPACKITECKRKTSPTVATSFSTPGTIDGYSFSTNINNLPSASIVVPNKQLKRSTSLTIELLQLNENLMDTPSDILNGKAIVLNTINIADIAWNKLWSPVTTSANPAGQMWTYKADVAAIQSTLTISVLYLGSADSVYVYNQTMAMANGGVKISVSADHWNLLTRPSITKTWATSCVFRITLGSDRMTVKPAQTFSDYPGLPAIYPIATAENKMTGSVRAVPVGEYGDPGRLSPSVYLVYNTSDDQATAQAASGATSFYMATYFVIPSDGNATFSYDFFVELSPPAPPPPKAQLLGSTVGFAFLIVFIVLIVAFAIFAVIMWRFPKLRRETLPCLGRAADPVEYF